MVPDGHADHKVGITIAIGVIEGARVASVPAGENDEVPVPLGKELERAGSRLHTESCQVLLTRIVVGSLDVVLTTVEHGLCSRRMSGECDEEESQPQDLPDACSDRGGLWDCGVKAHSPSTSAVQTGIAFRSTLCHDYTPSGRPLLGVRRAIDESATDNVLCLTALMRRILATSHPPTSSRTALIRSV